MTIAIALTVLVFVSTFFVWLHLSVQRAVKRQLEMLASLPCPSCASHYGAELAQRARQEYFERCEARRAQRPDLRINFERYWLIQCAQCSAQAQFHFEIDQLTAVNTD